MSTDSNGITVIAKALSGSGTPQDALSIVIGGTASSVYIGRAINSTSTNESTAYDLPMSVIVSDTNGNPVSGAHDRFEASALKKRAA